MITSVLNHINRNVADIRGLQCVSGGGERASRHRREEQIMARFLFYGVSEYASFKTTVAFLAWVIIELKVQTATANMADIRISRKGLFTVAPPGRIGGIQ